jgi:hypothetical protein
MNTNFVKRQCGIAIIIVASGVVGYMQHTCAHTIGMNTLVSIKNSMMVIDTCLCLFILHVNTLSQFMYVYSVALTRVAYKTQIIHS